MAGRQETTAALLQLLAGAANHPIIQDAVCGPAVTSITAAALQVQTLQTRHQISFPDISPPAFRTSPRS